MRPRIAWFSSLPGFSAPSSVSAYTTEMLAPRLSQDFEIELFHDGFESYGAFKTHHYLSAFRRHRECRFDAFLYHIEDSASSRFARSHAGLFPGITWFHNFICFDDGPPTLWASPWRTVVQKYRGEELSWLEHDAIPRKEGKVLSREASLSPVSIFSTAQSHGEYQRTVESRLCGEESQSWMIPYPVTLSGSAVPPREGGQKIVAFCGAPRIEHRVHKILPALCRWGNSVTLRWLIDPSEREEAARYARESGVASVQFIEGRSPAAWRSIVQDADTALHTIFSVFAEPYPWVAISLSCGVPVVMSLFGSSEDIPESLVYHVEPGETETRQTEEALRRALNEPDNSLRLARKEYVAEFHSPDIVAHELSLAIRSALPLLRKVETQWGALQAEARAEIVGKASRLLADPSMLRSVWTE
jgi:glycosyltransferase involved in cell wall biosynthesis